MDPAALAKAHSLHRFAVDQGAPLETFQLALTEPEAMELVEWYAQEHGGANEAFDLDVAIARRTHNPWGVLENFNLLGLAIVPANLALN